MQTITNKYDSWACFSDVDIDSLGMGCRSGAGTIREQRGQGTQMLRKIWSKAPAFPALETAGCFLPSSELAGASFEVIAKQILFDFHQAGAT